MELVLIASFTILFLTFQSSGVIETGLSDFHKITVTVMKTTFQKLNSKITHYRDYRKYSNYSFR